MPQERRGDLHSPGDQSLGAGPETSPGPWSLFPRSGGHTAGSGQAVWEVMGCSEHAEHTLHSQPRAGEESGVQKSQRERQ